MGWIHRRGRGAGTTPAYPPTTTNPNFPPPSGGPLAQPRLTDATNWAFLGSFLLQNTVGATNGGFGTRGAPIGLGPYQGGQPTLYVSGEITVASTQHPFALGQVLVPPDNLLSMLNPVPAGSLATTLIGPTWSLGDWINANAAQKIGNGFQIGSPYYDAANSRVLVPYFAYYPNPPFSDGAQHQTYNCVSLDLTLSQASLVPNLVVGNSVIGGKPLDGAVYGSGWGTVGSEWVPLIGGNILASIGMLSVDSQRCGSGPGVYAFTPSNLSVANNVPSNPLPTITLTNYGNPVGGSTVPPIFVDPVNGVAVDSFVDNSWSYGSTGGLAAFNLLPTNNYWAQSAAELIASAFIPTGKRTLVVMGTHCQGVGIYGNPTSDITQTGRPNTTGSGGPKGGIITATATQGSNQLTNVVVTSPGGVVNVNCHICAIDGDGFYTKFPGFDISAFQQTQVSAWNAGTATITLNANINTALIQSGSYTFNLNDGTVLGYDPASSGAHGWVAYPYAFYIWYYDMTDVMSVINGIKQPWQINPYFVGALPNPPTVQSGYATHLFSQMGYGAFDPVQKRYYAKVGNQNSQPVIGVWQMQ